MLGASVAAGASVGAAVGWATGAGADVGAAHAVMMNAAIKSAGTKNFNTFIQLSLKFRIINL